MSLKYLKLFLLLSLAFLVGCGEDEIQKEPLRPVRSKKVYASGGSRVRTFAGVSQYGTKSNLSFKVAGTVQRVNIKVGDQVSAGQLLIQLDAADYEIRVKEAEAARSQARAQERQAQANYERVRELWENRSVAKSDLEAARAAYETAHEQDNIAKKRRKLARNQLEYTSLKAPVAGSISEVRIDVNENVGAGKTVAVLTSGSYFEVQLTMPEILISEIKQGEKVDIKFDAIKGKIYKGEITEVGVAAAGFATTFPVTVRLVETDEAIRSGMAAEVDFVFESAGKREVFMVPSYAVSEDRDGRFVFTVEDMGDGTGIIHKKDVEIGSLLDDGIEVFSGLADGDYIVTAGVSKIREGMKVKFNAAEIE